MRARIAQYLRRLRDGLHESFTEEYSPQEVSGSFAIGVFITMLPTLGAGLLVFVLLSYLSERINKIALFASVLVVNPAVKWGVYAASFTLGVFLLGPVDEPGQIEFSLDVGREILLRLLVGNLLLAAGVTVVGYLVVYRMVLRYRDHKLTVVETALDRIAGEGSKPTPADQRREAVDEPVDTD